MPEETRAITIDLLVVSRYSDPPAPDVVSKTIASTGLGTALWRYPPLGEGNTTPGRQKLGHFEIRASNAPATSKMTVYQHEKAITSSMDETAFATLARGLGPGDGRTLREGRLAYNIQVTTLRPAVLPALNWSMRLLRALMDLTDGTAVDPAAQRCCSRDQIMSFIGDDPLVHITFQSEQWAAESTWLHTHGMQKFGEPELGLVGVPLSLEPEALSFLRDVALNLINGGRLSAGGEIDLGELGSVVAVSAPVDVEHQAPYGRFRLIDLPQPGEPERATANRLLKNIALAEAEKQADTGDTPGALDTIERILAADLDECAALSLKARLSLAAGDVNAAIDLGELMELRVPDDYRGPLTIGMALATLGRYREALSVLNRAIEREPEAAEIFAARSAIYERLGNRQMAAEDRAHASYLQN
ncbi:MAG: tetratricopeptide repeat protein [Ktedonobacterales bacterium]